MSGSGKQQPKPRFRVGQGHVVEPGGEEGGFNLLLGMAVEQLGAFEFATPAAGGGSKWGALKAGASPGKTASRAVLQLAAS